MEKKDVDKVIERLNYDRVKKRREKIKQELIQYKGGKCEICGYDKCSAALDFHHLEPSEKDFGISSSSVLSFDRLKKEVDKCILVCANCHRELHFKEDEKKRAKESKELQEAFFEIMKNRESYNFKHVKSSYKYLPKEEIINMINNNIKREDILSKYHINNRTFNKFLEENNISYSKRKIINNKPSKDELIELLSKFSKNKIAKMYNVTWQAVNKWCMKYEI